MIKGKHKLGSGRYIRRNGQTVPAMPGDKELRIPDNDDMKSFGMGCPDPAEQKKRLAKLSRKGVDGARYDPQTCELMFPGGFHAQKKVAEAHGMRVG